MFASPPRVPSDLPNHSIMELRQEQYDHLISRGVTPDMARARVGMPYRPSGYAVAKAVEDIGEVTRNTPERIAYLRSLPYDEYLRTEWWQRLRIAALKRANYRCFNGARHRGPLNVHHLTYERLGTELDRDLQVLCRKCHEAVHGK